MTNLMDLLNKILEAANEVVTWAKNVSSHTHRHEIRSMGARPLPHEVIRQISKLIEELRPHDDQISALRGIQDWVLRYVRAMMVQWGPGAEGIEFVMLGAFTQARLLCEEACRRTLEGANAQLRDPLAILIATLRNYERVQKKNFCGHESLGLL